MVLFQNHSDPKYQLLESPKKKCSCVAHSWAIFGLIVLSITITLISLVMIWDQIKQMQRKTETLDIVLFGPKRENSEYRALSYALANDTTGGSRTKFIYKPNYDVETYQHVEKPYALVCYYVIPSRSSSVDRLYPSGIDASLCTHIIVSFATIHNNSIHFPDTDIVDELLSLKRNNTNLKLLLSVISFSTSTDAFAAMVSSSNNRKMFIESATRILKIYSLDGIDLDWEFPAWPETRNISQKDQFTSLLKEMRTAFGKNFLISVAVAAPYIISDRAYDIPQMALYVDFVNLMCYDFHSYVWYLPFIGPNSPLFADSKDFGYESTLNTNYTVHYWIQAGMPKNKIMVGVPLYGHSWTLKYPTLHDYGALAEGYGSIGEKGFVSYRQVCEFTSLKGATVVFDGNTRVPYAYKDKEWFSYDNERSISYKAEYISEMGLAGAMVFSLNEDDYTGMSCVNGETYPLVKRIKTVLLDDNL
uniref:Chitinase 7 n=1 Tax=Phenacoccus solenopsis TaxID=483260 RepID=A0A4Y5SUW8_9HEMI|nr:chitinase 7 [Phenacoccus solenopsis]